MRRGSSATSPIPPAAELVEPWIGLNQAERWFGLLTDKQLRRGVHKSLAALEKGIRDWIDDWNTNPKPLVWTKTADQILERLSSYLQ